MAAGFREFSILLLWAQRWLYVSSETNARDSTGSLLCCCSSFPIRGTWNMKRTEWWIRTFFSEKHSIISMLIMRWELPSTATWFESQKFNHNVINANDPNFESQGTALSNLSILGWLLYSVGVIRTSDNNNKAGRHSYSTEKKEAMLENKVRAVPRQQRQSHMLHLSL